MAVDQGLGSALIHWVIKTGEPWSKGLQKQGLGLALVLQGYKKQGTRPHLANFCFRIFILPPVPKFPAKLEASHSAPVLLSVRSPFPPVLSLGGAVRVIRGRKLSRSALSPDCLPLFFGAVVPTWGWLVGIYMICWHLNFYLQATTGGSSGAWLCGM